jgi:hypothetical protein
MSKKLMAVTKKLFESKRKTGPEDILFRGSTSGSSRRDEILKHIDPTLVGRTICYQRSEVNIDIFIPFYNINLLIVFHTVLQDSESVG